MPTGQYERKHKVSGPKRKCNCGTCKLCVGREYRRAHYWKQKQKPKTQLPRYEWDRT